MVRWRITLLLLGLLLILAAPTLAHGFTFNSDGLWRAEYYNNPTLSGNPVVTQDVSRVAFDWGLWRPADGVPVDNFSARFTTSRYFDAGVYRMTVLVDDAVRLFVDGNKLLDTFDNPQPGTQYSLDVTLVAGTHSIQLDYLERTHTAYIFFDWARIETGGPALPVLETSSPNNASSWSTTYYSSTDLSGTPVRTVTDRQPTRDFGLGAPIAEMAEDNFSVRWESVQGLPAGTYQVRVRAADGVRVYLNGGQIINAWPSDPNAVYAATFNLNQGDHRFVVEFFKQGGGESYIYYNLVRLSGVIYQPYASFASGVPAQPGIPTGLAPTGFRVTAADRLNIRRGPGISFDRIGQMPFQGQASVLGRDAASNWWLIDYGGLVGWVSARFGRIEPGANIGAIPVVQ
jgi:hypothetical protein